MSQTATEMSRRGLSVVDTSEMDKCGAETTDGTPCQRQAEGRCWQHSGQSAAGPPPPSHLGDLACEEWNKHVRQVAQTGVLGYVVERGGLSVLEQACEFYEGRRVCYRDLKSTGSRVKGRRGEDKTNPSASKFKSFGREYRIALGEWRELVCDALESDSSNGGTDEDAGVWGDAW